jgi:hypothetical protein
MDVFKKAALHLHGLEPVDCHWILEQLPEMQRETLAAMLDELRELGIPRDPTVLTLSNNEGALDQNSRKHPKAGREEPVFAAIANAPISRLGEILENESDATIAAVLLADEWPWKTPLLTGFDLDRQKKISREMETLRGKLTEKFRSSLLSVLAERLAEPSTSDRTSGVSFLKARKPIRQWRLFRRRTCRQ